MFVNSMCEREGKSLVFGHQIHGKQRTLSYNLIEEWPGSLLPYNPSPTLLQCMHLIEAYNSQTSDNIFNQTDPTQMRLEGMIT